MSLAAAGGRLRGGGREDFTPPLPLIKKMITQNTKIKDENRKCRADNNLVALYKSSLSLSSVYLIRFDECACACVCVCVCSYIQKLSAS